MKFQREDMNEFCMIPQIYQKTSKLLAYSLKFQFLLAVLRKKLCFENN